MSIHQDPSTFVAKLADEWEYDEVNGLRGPKGTWVRATNGEVERLLRSLPANRVFALVCCPKCGTIFALSHEHHEVDEDGKITFTGRGKGVIRCTKCDFARTLYLDRYWNRPLYCLVYREKRPGAITKFLYTHAANQKEARKSMGPLNDGTKGKNIQVIACAPAIGFFVETEVDPNNVHGTILTAN